MKTQIHTRLRIPLLALAFMALTLPGCSPTHQSSKTAIQAAGRSEPETINETKVVGDWIIAVEPTADVLARAQFGARQTITIKAGAAHPETNTVIVVFDQKKYDESKTFWTDALKKPEMKWQLILKPDHSGEHITRDIESTKPRSSPVRWELRGDELRLVYPEEKRFNTFNCRLLSLHELHYPMEPLGGWFVMRHE